ncbi:RBBP9/YdeN family alpha/beta hydrolase [Curtobacterium aurantiacum]|uniref:Alpha/beta hydrolase n=1 Tax=Curtobacterium aurantiacum TaxID=3236919 RepID=A0ABS5VFM5_9MICO|nr:alpha/beta hydrolase [Curtobacterium flaccumfaciens]MBT1545368.1 alpha/beta hydrolase [Curtobacterium flaccumfaciens pv. flaccumfaciens]MBT1588274.1 alpha/beta hydrolase [Curtobacterium flaccumfaciens pv. flaccumfaciens]
MSRQRPWVIVPGIWNSDPDHWQSVWQREHDQRRAAVRIAPASWSEPDPDDWRAAISRAVAACPGPPVLIAHSLGVLAVADWLASTTDAPDRVAGAFLVAPPDPLGGPFPAEASGFAAPRPVPAGQQVPTRLVVSDDDPYCSADRALAFAQVMGAQSVRVGALGHVNVASGVGPWPTGRALLRTFEDGIRPPR